ncbi:ATP-binding protein [Streptomyces sp. NPDC002589]|uniref:ATP-binding protein n=1 Tax=Streptomyces sp. NPDC002589 TaxID=3154420 RepID=UPI00331E3108
MRGLELGISPAGFAAHLLDPHPSSVRQARRFLQHCLGQWKLPAPNDNATLVVSELSTNALRHSGTPGSDPVWLAIILYTEELICAVADPSPKPPRTTALDSHSDAGRGLHVVSALSSSWGWSPSPPPGKIVWARLPL